MLKITKRMLLLSGVVASGITFAGEEENSKLKLSGSWAYYNSLPAVSEAYAGNLFGINPAYRFSSGDSMSANCVLGKSTSGEHETFVPESSLSFNYRSLEVSPDWSASPSLTLHLPADSTRRSTEGMIAGIDATSKLSIPLQKLVAGLSLSYRLGAIRLFHKDTLANNGKNNQFFLLKNTLNVGYSLTEALSWSGAAIHNARWAHHGKKTNVVQLDTSVNYQFSSNIGGGVGYSNYPSTFGAVASSASNTSIDQDGHCGYAYLSFEY